MSNDLAGIDKGFLTGVGLLFLIMLIGAFAPSISPHDPLAIQLSNRLSPPSWDFPFGTDHLGRCVFSRILYGIRISVTSAFLIMLLTLLISLPIGLMTGFLRGRADRFLMRMIDSTLAIPDIVLTIAIVGLLGPSLVHLILAIIMVRWASYVRLIRSLVQKVCQEEYILSARMAGNSRLRIMWRYILPQIASPIGIFGALDMGRIVLMMAGLSFLGLGPQPPTPEWGVMLHDATAYFQLAPHVMIFPGLAILLFVLCCQFISERYRKSEPADIARGVT
ncbi:ABC transporter permease subunit [Brevibacillus humidisoli]|uniref:nickel transporter permease n=1 Tax=Brevibacillus humidisoli TaxID=2895522 RepID=UPI001E49748F|nr:nickel transporter permease [Brevibacillus humidisoli]UFJ43325.1 ABC transporter permease subunit [Brevibacillus humidisoli]